MASLAWGCMLVLHQESVSPVWKEAKGRCMSVKWEWIKIEQAWNISWRKSIFWCEGKTINSYMSWRVKYVAALHQECTADLPRARKRRWQDSGALLFPSVVCLHVQGSAACRDPAQRSSKGGLGKHPVSSRGRPAATRCFRLLPGCHSVNTGSLCGTVGWKRFALVCGWCVWLGMLCGD